MGSVLQEAVVSQSPAGYCRHQLHLAPLHRAAPLERRALFLPIATTTHQQGGSEKSGNQSVKTHVYILIYAQRFSAAISIEIYYSIFLI